MIPMQEPANMPLEVMCHVEERKHASMVYQFQSICQGAREHKSFSREKTGKLKAVSDETGCGAVQRFYTVPSLPYPCPCLTCSFRTM